MLDRGVTLTAVVSGRRGARSRRAETCAACRRYPRRAGGSRAVARSGSRPRGGRDVPLVVRRARLPVAFGTAGTRRRWAFWSGRDRTAFRRWTSCFAARGRRPVVHRALAVEAGLTGAISTSRPRAPCDRLTDGHGEWDLAGPEGESLRGVLTGMPTRCERGRRTGRNRALRRDGDRRPVARLPPARGVCAAQPPGARRPAARVARRVRGSRRRCLEGPWNSPGSRRAGGRSRPGTRDRPVAAVRAGGAAPGRGNRERRVRACRRSGRTACGAAPGGGSAGDFGSHPRPARDRIGREHRDRRLGRRRASGSRGRGGACEASPDARRPRPSAPLLRLAEDRRPRRLEHPLPAVRLQVADREPGARGSSIAWLGRSTALPWRR